MVSQKRTKSSSIDLRFIDLFAGIGGIRMAFESAGGECVFSSEWDSSAQKTYHANFGEIPHGDITKISAKEIPKFNILVAGFPCQPFSSIGKRQGFNHPTQGTLFYDIVRILKFHKPDMFLLENVQGIRNHNGGNTYKIIKSSLKKLGYEVFDEILNASDYGVPQDRKRIYFVGFSKKLGTSNDINFKFPNPNKEKVYIGKFVENNVNDRSISKHLQQKYMFKVDDGRPQIKGPDSKITVKTLTASYHKIQRLTGTFVKDGPTGLRLLTTDECKAIMGFPKNFKVPVSRTQMYRQFGNSVAVPVVKKVAEAMVNKYKELI